MRVILYGYLFAALAGSVVGNGALRVNVWHMCPVAPDSVYVTVTDKLATRSFTPRDIHDRPLVSGVLRTPELVTAGTGSLSVHVQFKNSVDYTLWEQLIRLEAKNGRRWVLDISSLRLNGREAVDILVSRMPERLQELTGRDSMYVYLYSHVFTVDELERQLGTKYEDMPSDVIQRAEEYLAAKIGDRLSREDFEYLPERSGTYKDGKTWPEGKYRYDGYQVWWWFRVPGESDGILVRLTMSRDGGLYDFRFPDCVADLGACEFNINSSDAVEIAIRAGLIGEPAEVGCPLLRTDLGRGFVWHIGARGEHVFVSARDGSIVRSTLDRKRN